MHKVDRTWNQLWPHVADHHTDRRRQDDDADKERSDADWATLPAARESAIDARLPSSTGTEIVGLVRHDFLHPSCGIAGAQNVAASGAVSSSELTHCTMSRIGIHEIAQALAAGVRTAMQR